MTINRTNFDDVTEEDLEALRLAAVPEGLTIDYKRDTYGGSDKDKREFLKDVSSFANSAGGHLLIGVADTAGLPTAIPGLPGTNIDKELQRLEQLAQDGIQPRAPIRIRRIRLKNGESVIAVRVARSWSTPHRVIAQGVNRFYKRNSAGCYEASLEELRAMFNADNELAARVRSFREERVRLIRGGSVPRLMNEGQLVMHVLPVASVLGNQNVDLTIVEQQRTLFPPFDQNSLYSFRYNLDGALTERNGPAIGSFTQVFRNGQIETAKGHVLRTNPELGTFIHARDSERAAIFTLRKIVAGLQVLGLPPPIVVGLTVIGCAAAYYLTRGLRMDDARPPPIGSDVAFLPDGLIERYGQDDAVDAALRPAFDALWNSAGAPRAAWFAASGEWAGPSLAQDY